MATNFPLIKFFKTSWDSDIFSTNFSKNLIRVKIFENFWNSLVEDKNKKNEKTIIEKPIVTYIPRSK